MTFHHSLQRIALVALLGLGHLTSYASAEFQTVSAVVLSRHGARTILEKDTFTFREGEEPRLTIEGMLQLQDAGKFLNDRWSNEQTAMKGFTGIYDPKTVYVRSSNTHRTVLSAQMLASGLFPPQLAAEATLVLANGTTLTAPGEGATRDQLVPVFTENEEDDLILRGWLECSALEAQASQLYKSRDFAEHEKQHTSFFNILSQKLNTKVGLKDMWNVYDFINTQQSYNATFEKLSTEQWEELTDLVNDVEYHKFESGQGAANFLGNVLTTLNTAAENPTARKLSYYSGHYTTFVNFFGLTGLSTSDPSLRTIPEYGSLLIFELLADDANPAAENLVKISFRNGQAPARTLVLPDMGERELIPISTFYTSFSSKVAFNLQDWCRICENTSSRGCSAADSTYNDSTLYHVCVGAVFGAIGGLVLSKWHSKRKRSQDTGAQVPVARVTHTDMVLPYSTQRVINGGGECCAVHKIEVLPPYEGKRDRA
ncbi:hypothetical protein HDU85_007799 [Gaertneriomyces sp. JEL0708]|nr:hypothetical protein HDU85_007799 [Gaertneriomyces sp. JEL0708]